jgi:hypothetical protein
MNTDPPISGYGTRRPKQSLLVSSRTGCVVDYLDSSVNMTGYALWLCLADVMQERPHSPRRPGTRVRHDTGPAGTNFQARQPAGSMHYASARRLGPDSGFDTLILRSQERFHITLRRSPATT